MGEPDCENAETNRSQREHPAGAGPDYPTFLPATTLTGITWTGITPGSRGRGLGSVLVPIGVGMDDVGEGYVVNPNAGALVQGLLRIGSAPAGTPRDELRADGHEISRR